MRPLIAAASAGVSFSGTTWPSTPSRMMSRGPETQSTLTTGSPTPIASSSTIGKPSWRELSTYSEARDISSCSLRVKPSRPALSAMPSSSIWRWRLSRSPPEPKIFSRQSGWSLTTSAQAGSSRSNPFWRHEAAGGDHDLVVERGAVAADVRHRVGEAPRSACGP